MARLPCDVYSRSDSRPTCNHPHSFHPAETGPSRTPAPSSAPLRPRSRQPQPPARPAIRQACDLQPASHQIAATPPSPPPVSATLRLASHHSGHAGHSGHDDTSATKATPPRQPRVHHMPRAMPPTAATHPSATATPPRPHFPRRHLAPRRHTGQLPTAATYRHAATPAAQPTAASQVTPRCHTRHAPRPPLTAKYRR